jgi:hypothetical protein
MLDKLSPYWKAVIGFVTPGAVLLVSAVHEASAGGVDITVGEWVTAVAAMVITAGGVYTVPNRELDHDPPAPPGRTANQRIADGDI